MHALDCPLVGRGILVDDYDAHGSATSGTPVLPHRLRRIQRTDRIVPDFAQRRACQ